MMRMTLALVLAILSFAVGRYAIVLAHAQNPVPGPVRGDGQAGWKAPQPPEPPAVDVSAEVRLTIAATRDQYEQLEPIKLRVELTNLSKSDMTFEDESECHLFGFEIVNMTHQLAVDNVTNYGKLSNNKPNRGRITLKPGETRHFASYPNLCIDMTPPRLYSIVLTMELKRTADARRCLTRSKMIRVEVTHLLKGR